MQQPLAYGIRDFAALIGIGQTTIFKMIRAGELKAAQQSAIAVNVALEYDLLGMALNEPELAANSAVTSQHFCDFINGMVWDAIREGGSLAVVASGP